MMALAAVCSSLLLACACLKVVMPAGEELNTIDYFFHYTDRRMCCSSSSQDVGLIVIIMQHH